jgi:hypothetical protein
MDSKARIQVKVKEIDPRQLKLLDRNAHYMRHETYQRLVDNLQNDGAATSAPYVWLRHDDDTRQPLFDPDDPQAYLVLSGNHRVKAAIDAGLETLHVMYSDHYLPPDRRLAIQLSHNSIFGEDDPAVLKELFESIDDVDFRLYAGLDDKQLELLESVSIPSLSEAALDFQTVSLVFLPDEVDAINEVWERVEGLLVGGNLAWLARWADYDKALDALEAASAASGVRNTATAFMVVLDIFQRHIEDLQGLYLSEDGEPLEKARQVPVQSLFPDPMLKAEDAATIRKALNKMRGRGEIADPGEALAKWARAYLENE